MEITSQGGELVLQELAEYSPRVLKALLRAMNRGLATGRSTAAKLISAEVGVSQKDIRAAMTYQEATGSRLVARLGLSNKKIPLSKFNARGPEPSKGRGRGVSWRIGAVAKRDTTLFLATMRSGHRGVFERFGPSTSKSRGAWSKNLPLQQKYGPSLGYILEKKRQAVEAAMMASFQKNFDREMAYRSRTGTVTVTESGGDG